MMIKTFWFETPLEAWILRPIKQPSIRYNESNKLVATILPKGNRIERSYDSRLLEESYTRGARSADSSTTKTQYDKDGLPAKKIDGRGKVTIFNFDVFNRLERIEDALGNVILKRYDKSGNIVLEGFFEDRKNGKYRLLSRTAFQYNEHNHQVTLSQNLFQDVVEVEKEQLIVTLTSNLLPGRILMTQYYYDRGGRVIKILNPKQQTTILSYDAVGRRKSIVDPLGNNVEILYDANDNIIRHDQYELVRDSTGNRFVD